MFNFLKRFVQKPLSQHDLTQFAQQLNDMCNSVEAKNLALVKNAFDHTSKQQYAQLVKAAVYFVKECIWVFNSEYVAACDISNKFDYCNEFIVYLEEVRHEFDNHHHDPDGIGGGTITDIIVKIKGQKLKIKE